MTGKVLTCKYGHTSGRYACGWCIECARTYGAMRHQANREKALARMRAYRAANLEKARARDQAYRVVNRDKLRASKATHYRANAMVIRAKVALWRLANPEKARAGIRAWRKANPDVCAASAAHHRAMKRNAPGRGIAAADWRNIIAESLGICAYCNERKRLSMDHIEPLSRSGEHDVENIAAVCNFCNSSKKDSPLLLWLALIPRREVEKWRKARVKAATKQLAGASK